MNTWENSPKVILLDTSNGIHGPNLCSRTNQLHPNVRSHLDDRVLIVRELRGCCIWVELDVRRDELLKISFCLGAKICWTYMCGNKEWEGSRIGEEANVIDRGDNGVNL